MASSVVAALPSLASRLSIKSRLRVNASRFLKSSLFSTFLSSAALATIFMSIRNDRTLSFLVAGSICARLGPSSSSANARSLWRISAPLTLASTGLASCARTGRPACRTSARQPIAAAEARPRRRPVFVSGNEEVMENPYLLKMGLFGAAGHSPNRTALATRKVCQNDEILDSLVTLFRGREAAGTSLPQPLQELQIGGPRAPLTRLWPSHISAKPKSMAIALGCVLAVEPWIAQFPFIWRMLPDRGRRRN